MLAHPSKLRWGWWWAFGLLIALPALLLALLGIRAVDAEKLERQQQITGQQNQLAKLADIAIGSGLSELESELKYLDADQQLADAGIKTVFANRLLLKPGAFALKYDLSGTLRISNHKIFLGGEEETGLPLLRWPPAIEEAIFQAEAAEAQSRLADAAGQYKRISAHEPRLRDWSNLAIDRMSHAKVESLYLSGSDGLTPSGVPVSLIATANLETIPRQDRRHLDPQLVETLNRLRSGRWWLSYDQRRFYDDYIRGLLGGDVEISEDPVLTSAAEIERIVRAAPPLERDAPSHGFWQGHVQRFLIAWSPSTQDPNGWLGFAITHEALDEFMDLVLNAVLDGQPFAVAVLDGKGATMGTGGQLQEAVVRSEPLRSVAGWEIAFGNTAAQGLLADRRLLWYGLILLLVSMLGMGIAMTVQMVGHEKELTRRQDEFVAGLTHEFKSPITGIRLLIERMMSGSVPNLVGNEYPAAIRSETFRLERHIDRLMEAKQISEGRKVYKFEAASITEIAQAAVDELRPFALTRGIGIEARLDLETPLRQFDKAAFTDALANLIDNAIKYSSSGTTVILSVKSNTDCAVIEVSDEGSGIEARDIPHIFERFYRGRHAAQLSSRGTGLGLALVRATVEAHGGEVNVQSAPGHGSTFAIRLPLRQGADSGEG